jgi:mevalonate kinase
MNVGTACAKSILVGEHAVVYGQPAIAVPISSLRVMARVDLNVPAGQGIQIVAADLGKVLLVDITSGSLSDALSLTIQLTVQRLELIPRDFTLMLQSQIPLASGLGSGAAVSTAMIRALLAAFNRSMPLQEVNEIVYEVERIHHGTPSGIDNTVIVYEQPVYFVRSQPIEFLRIGQSFTILIGDTGHGALTRVAVGDVRRLYETDPHTVEPVLEAVGALVSQAREAIETGNIPQLGRLMSENHRYLQQLTVSSPELDYLVDAALSAGALGAKLSGGGRGGNMIALVEERTSHTVREALRRAGAVRVFETLVAGDA